MKPAVRRVFLSLMLSLLPGLCWAQSVTVQNMRLWRAPDHTRLVFDLSGPLEHRLFSLQEPERIVIDLEHARLQGNLPEVDKTEPVLAALRAARYDADTLRVVLDLKVATQPRTFVLKPVGPYGHRLVIDLYDAKALETEKREEREAATVPPAPPEKREIVIAIDAGHGGEDPGAIGRRYRTREKDVTLGVARELARLVAATPGMRPVLTRDGDYYVPLERRFQKARKNNVDLFLSIHADSLPGRRTAYGSSVFALSTRGATHALARAVADRENYSDLIGGVSLNDKPDDVRKTLLDLQQDKSIEYSLLLGNDMLAELRRVGPVHLSRVTQAGFAVLKAVDVPSVLIETAFLSNPNEELKLRSPEFQRRMAEAILAGAKRYLARSGSTVPVPDAVRPLVVQNPGAGSREHVVRPGETLAAIARQYNVHVEAIRFLNGLDFNDPPAGARLRIPAVPDAS